MKQRPGQEEWLLSLREKSYDEVKEALLELAGVGPKVADCIALMSLDKLESVPVDTHVWQVSRISDITNMIIISQIAIRDYKFKSVTKHKSLTAANYKAIGDHFRKIFGDKAGWAHSILFAADLRQFAERLLDKENEADEPSPKKLKTN